MFKAIRRILLAVVALALAAAIAAAALYWNELRTLMTLKKVDGYPLYTMAYSGDYGFTDFLKTGAESDRDIEKYVTGRLLKGLPIDLNISSAGCSAFTAINTRGQRIFARNFDFDYAPALLLEASPPDGYRSVSVVNLAFAGYGEGNLPDTSLANRFLTLAGPYLPFDGMNEKGVVVALLAVPHAEPPKLEGRVTLNTTTAIRLILDRAASVQEAIDLLGGYNLYFSGGVQCHYLIADAAGDSAIVEFLDGEIQVTRSDERHQTVTNFIVCQGLSEGEGGSEFQRYDTIEQALDSLGSVIGEEEAMALLGEARIPGRTQWSVVYNQTSGEARISMGANYDKVYRFKLPLSK
jgi:hypothetical protein